MRPVERSVVEVEGGACSSWWTSASGIVAVDSSSHFGYWGGFTFEERHRLWRSHDRLGIRNNDYL